MNNGLDAERSHTTAPLLNSATVPGCK